MIEMKAGVSLVGERGPELTVLDAEESRLVVLREDVGDAHIDGLTIQNGFLGGGGSGAGVRCTGDSKLVLSNCVVRNNRVALGWGGLRGWTIDP